MKKIIDIIQMPEANECFALSLDYKLERKSLKRYAKSLKTFKERIDLNSTQMLGVSKSLYESHSMQSKNRKK